MKDRTGLADADLGSGDEAGGDCGVDMTARDVAETLGQGRHRHSETESDLGDVELYVGVQAAPAANQHLKHRSSRTRSEQQTHYILCNLGFWKDISPNIRSVVKKILEFSSSYPYILKLLTTYNNIPNSKITTKHFLSDHSNNWKHRKNTFYHISKD